MSGAVIHIIPTWNILFFKLKLTNHRELQLSQLASEVQLQLPQSVTYYKTTRLSVKENPSYPTPACNRQQSPLIMMCHNLFQWENKPVYSISITPDLYWEACGKLSHPNQRQKYSHPIGWHATAQFNRPFQISLSSRLTLRWTSSFILGVFQTPSQARCLRRSHGILRTSVFVFISKNGKATQITARGIERRRAILTMWRQMLEGGNSLSCCQLHIHNVVNAEFYVIV